MAIEFRCSQCNQLLRVADTSAGKNARCPKCQALMQVPAASTTGGGATLPGAPPPAPLAPAPLPSQAPQPFPAFTPPSPAAPKQDDPFGFLNQPAGGGGGSLPPPPANPFGGITPAPKPTSNPYGGTAPTSSSVNPYASPGGGYSYQPGFGQQAFAGDRPGLPWESKGQNVATWWETAKLCMLQPSQAFSIMRRGGGLGQPMMYSGAGLAAGFLGRMVWNVPLIVGLGLLAGNRGGGGPVMAFQLVGMVVGGAVGVVLGATVGLLIASAIMHVCLMIVGGAKQNFEVTLRVLGYAQGATFWLQVIPFVGALVGAIWAIVLEVIGLAKAHEISIGKALLAVLIPIIFCTVVMIGLFVVIIAIVGAAAINANR